MKYDTIKNLDKACGLLTAAHRGEQIFWDVNPNKAMRRYRLRTKYRYENQVYIFTIFEASTEKLLNAMATAVIDGKMGTFWDYLENYKTTKDHRYLCRVTPINYFKYFLSPDDDNLEEFEQLYNIKR